MAGIDKTYIDNYDDYKRVVEYAKQTEFKCPNGTVIKLSDYLYPVLPKEDFKGQMPIMSSPIEIDYLLIKYCPLKIIQDRMSEIYGAKFIRSVKAGTSEFDTFIRPLPGKHIKFISKPSTHKMHKWYSDYKDKWVKVGYQVDCRYLRYNEKFDLWILPYELGEWHTTIAETECLSLKSVFRKILSWNLPVGTVCEIIGRYTDESCIIKITK